MRDDSDRRSSSRYASRKTANRLFGFAIAVPAAMVLALLVLIIGRILIKGFAALNLDFFTQSQKPFGEPGGGIVHAIIGSLLLLAGAAVITIPLALLASLYLYEHKNSQKSRVLAAAMSTLQGLPSIVIGVVIYAWIVVPSRGFSAIAGSTALSIVMLPIMTTIMKESFDMVPPSYMEGALALGVPRWRALTGVLIPAARSGIKESIGLGVARAAGETAPLLFTAFGSPYFSFNIAGPVSS
ncbi:MAG: ABC transporter permease subunit, partial [Rectinema sp.]|nr:ABC transporter permease subunit [Rectinema sp.]